MGYVPRLARTGDWALGVGVTCDIAYDHLSIAEHRERLDTERRAKLSLDRDRVTDGFKFAALPCPQGDSEVGEQQVVMLWLEQLILQFRLRPEVALLDALLPSLFVEREDCV
jgi:hypothetical protein